MILQGDVQKQLATLGDESVQCVVTSPPYWGLRDYKLPSQVWDGVDGCGHVWGDNLKGPDRGHPGDKSTLTGPQNAEFSKEATSQGQFCQRCNAWRGSLGLEPTPELYLHHVVETFREVRRVLRKDGTVWLNMGDSYCGTHASYETIHHRWQHTESQGRPSVKTDNPVLSGAGLKPKDLCMMPARLALALQADGWWLRRDIIEVQEWYCPCCGYQMVLRRVSNDEMIWDKPNPMPESCTDRPTSSHEYIFLLTKSARYFYDAEAVREAQEEYERCRCLREKDQGLDTIYNIASDGKTGQSPQSSSGVIKSAKARQELAALGTRNMRSVWNIATQPFPEAHFATFPEKLVQRCIMAGTSERGACPGCGAPWERILSNIETEAHGYQHHENALTEGCRMTGIPQKGYRSAQTLGWRPTCECPSTGSGQAQDRLRSRCHV